MVPAAAAPMRECRVFIVHATVPHDDSLNVGS